MTLAVEYHEELELDLDEHGTDLLDLWRGTLSFRRLDLAVRALPAESRFMRQVDPDAAFLTSWSVTDHLLATLIDMTGQLNSKNWKPIPRPSREAVAKFRNDEARRGRLIAREQAKMSRLAADVQRGSGA